MRYFIPIFALAGLVFVCGASAMQPKVRRAILAAHGALGCLLILVFNVAPMYRWAKPALPELEVNWIGVPLSLLDNSRMRLHLEEADVLARIDRDVPHDATLYMLDVNYYRDAQQGVYERAGLIRSDISTHYVSSRGFDPTERDFYVFSQRAPQLESLGRVTRLEDYLFHVER